MTRLTLIVLPLVLAGCLSQPVDSNTGKPFGAPVGVGDVRPTTAPSGGPVRYVTTKDIDPEAVRQVIDASKPLIPAPFQPVAEVIGALLVGYLIDRRARKRLEKHEEDNHGDDASAPSVVEK